MNPPYVFEVLENCPDWPGAIGLCRADIEEGDAQRALIILFKLQFGVKLTVQNISDMLAKTPKEWAFMKIRTKGTGRERTLDVARMEREPGEEENGNPVITRLQAYPAYEH